MNRKILQYISALCCAVLLLSCGPAKKTVESDAGYTEERYGSGDRKQKSDYDVKTVVENNSDWQDITISGTLSIGTTSSLSSAVVIKMIKDKSVSISIRPILGIEMGKIYFAGDTLTVVDKYHKAYVKESISSLLGDYINVPVLQNLLLSRPFLIGEGAVTADNSDNFKSSDGKDSENWVLSPKKQYGDFAYNFDMRGNNVSHFNIVVATSRVTGSYAMNFGNYKYTENGIMATEINASVPVSGIEVSLDLNYGKSIKWNTGADDSITVSSGFKRYGFADIMNLISKY